MLDLLREVPEQERRDARVAANRRASESPGYLSTSATTCLWWAAAWTASCSVNRPASLRIASSSMVAITGRMTRTSQVSKPMAPKLMALPHIEKPGFSGFQRKRTPSKSKLAGQAIRDGSLRHILQDVWSEDPLSLVYGPGPSAAPRGFP